VSLGLTRFSIQTGESCAAEAVAMQSTRRRDGAFASPVLPQKNSRLLGAKHLSGMSTCCAYRRHPEARGTSACVKRTGREYGQLRPVNPTVPTLGSGGAFGRREGQVFWRCLLCSAFFGPTIGCERPAAVSSDAATLFHSRKSVGLLAKLTPQTGKCLVTSIAVLVSCN
jgi:hypothetical protein